MYPEGAPFSLRVVIVRVQQNFSPHPPSFTLIYLSYQVGMVHTYYIIYVCIYLHIDTIHLRAFIAISSLSNDDGIDRKIWVEDPSRCSGRPEHAGCRRLHEIAHIGSRTE